MALIAGNQEANTGMSKAIYDKLREVLEPDLGEISEANLQAIQKGWQRLAYAVAKGVIEHIKTNMEIFDIKSGGNVSVPVSGNTGIVSGHQHSISLTGVQNNVVFTQSNDGTGHIR